MSTPPLPAGYQLIQPDQGTAPPPLPPGYRLIQPPGPGEQINDVGNKVIVPADGEPFAQTMQRAAAYGKTVTPDMINSETQSAPGKVAATLAAAPAMGFAGTAALAGASLSPQIAKAVAQHVAQPGTILKMPYGRAVEYYLVGKLGMSKDVLAKIAGVL
jgi:hypothetical protein